MSDDSWLSAYGEPYDPRPAIKRWGDGEAVDAPRELWEQLYHQGTVNSASYAAVGGIVRMMQEQAAPDWNAYTLVASIEEARETEGNPPVPFDLSRDYEWAWAALLPIAMRDLGQSNDELVVQGAFAVVAYAKGQRSLAAFALCTEDERREMLDG